MWSFSAAGWRAGPWLGSCASKRRPCASSSSKSASIRSARRRSRSANRASRSARTIFRCGWGSSRTCAAGSSKSSGFGISSQTATTATLRTGSSSDPAMFPPVPSFQLDRGRLENHLLAEERAAGVEVRRRLPGAARRSPAGRAAPGHAGGGRRHARGDGALGGRCQRSIGTAEAAARPGAAEHSRRQRLLVSRQLARESGRLVRAIPHGRRACRTACAG